MNHVSTKYLTGALACLSTLIGVVLLAACGATPPVHYHTLLDSKGEPASASSPRFLIDVALIGIPSQVDQAQIVVRSENGDMQLLENERWIAPLADEFRSALSNDLARQLNTIDVAGMPSSSSIPVLRVKVELRRFESAPGRYVAIDATWRLAFADSTRPALVCSNYLQEPIGSEYSDLARGHRKTLDLLASRIAVAAQQYATGGRATCSTRELSS